MVGQSSVNVLPNGELPSEGNKVNRLGLPKKARVAINVCSQHQMRLWTT